MKKLLRFCTISICLLGISGFSHHVAAVEMASAAKPKAAKPTKFVDVSELNVFSLLPSPPDVGSNRAKAEIAELHHLEDMRTPEQESQARSDSKTKDVSIFAEAMGPGFDLAALPATARLFDDIRNDEKAAADAAKMAFHRSRPSLVDPSLKTLESTPRVEETSSYPSGHATMAYSMGVVLASLAPSKAQAILARSSVYAENRLECGVHFRSDIVAGQVLGTVIAERMMHNPAFKVEYAAAAKELAAAHLIAK
ncbi:MAG: phosphatase PAP2 family protein [Rhodospirillaceae bacterium]|nr:MAG: phosphatase PAP2 family protein [Rhodospirillaceae bacterium]